MTTWEPENKKKVEENPGHGRALIQKFKRGESVESLEVERYCNSIVQFICYCHVCPYVNFELYTIVGILKVLYFFFSSLQVATPNMRGSLAVIPAIAGKIIKL